MKDALRRLDGDRCKICSRTGEDFRKEYGPDADFVLEHRDGDSANYDLGNLQLACYSCNGRKRPDFQGGAAETGNRERVKEHNGRGMEVSTNERQRKKRYLDRATPEFKKSAEIEPKVRRYLWENVSRDGGLLLKDAINEAAEYAGCDTQPVSRKIDKATSRIGPFDIFSDMHGNDFIILRKGYKPNPETAYGRLDMEISQQMMSGMREKLEQTKENAQEVLTAHARMADSLAYIGKQRDIAIREVMKVTGKSYDEVKAMLDQQAPPPRHFGDEPAAPVAVDKGGDQPPSAGAVAVKKVEKLPGVE